MTAAVLHDGERSHREECPVTAADCTIDLPAKPTGSRVRPPCKVRLLTIDQLAARADLYHPFLSQRKHRKFGGCRGRRAPRPQAAVRRQAPIFTASPPHQLPCRPRRRMRRPGASRYCVSRPAGADRCGSTTRSRRVVRSGCEDRGRRYPLRRALLRAFALGAGTGRRDRGGVPPPQRRGNPVGCRGAARLTRPDDDDLRLRTHATRSSPRYFWGFRRHLICPGQLIAGELAAELIRPHRKDEKPGFWETRPRRPPRTHHPRRLLLSRLNMAQLAHRSTQQTIPHHL